MSGGALANEYDELAAEYAKRRPEFDLVEVLADFAERLAAEGAICDLGCGAGEPVSAFFVNRGWQVVGVDISSGMLGLAAAGVPQMLTIQADMRDVEFSPDSFDAVTAIYSLFHVPWTDHLELFRRIRSWLRPGALFLFTYATSSYTGHDVFDGTVKFMGHHLPYSHSTPEVLRRQLTDAGFGVDVCVDREIGGETFLWVTARAL